MCTEGTLITSQMTAKKGLFLCPKSGLSLRASYTKFQDLSLIYADTFTLPKFFSSFDSLIAKHPMRHYLLYILVLLLCMRCVPITQQYGTNEAITGKALRTEDFIYEDSIKTVRLYPQLGVADQVLLPPIIPISQAQPLLLEFDEMGNEFDNYILKLVHCNADWSQSVLTDLEFMQDFNEVRITDYQFSFNTKVRYVHYKVPLPKVKVSGNYLVKVYREGNEADLILTKRFVVYTNQVMIDPNIGFTNLPSERTANQQIDFTINYNNFELVDPQLSIKVVLRQNYRWDNAITNLQPLYVKEFDKTLEYRSFNGENNFKGVNEYRFFQAESIQFLGFNTAKIDVTGAVAQVYLGLDKPRGEQAYLRNKDLNGNFLVNNYETNNGDTDADYVRVHFKLAAPSKPGNLYVIGAFNNWSLTNDNVLNYNLEKNWYEGSVLLKQGTYNYAYALQTPQGKVDETIFEGTHQATENAYEIIVYYRPMGGRYDQVIGYRKMTANE